MSKPKQRAMRLKEVIEQAADGLALAEMVVKLDANLDTMQVNGWDACVAAASAIVEKAGKQ